MKIKEDKVEKNRKLKESDKVKSETKKKKDDPEDAGKMNVDKVEEKKEYD